METRFLAERELRYRSLATQKVHIDRLWLKEASERHLRVVSGGRQRRQGCGQRAGIGAEPATALEGCRASSPWVPAARGVIMNILAASQVRPHRGLPDPAPTGPAGG